MPEAKQCQRRNAALAFETLEQGRERAERAKLRVRFFRLYAARIPLVDGVFCDRLLHHILPTEEREMFLREFHRVTRSYLIVSFFDYHTFVGVRRVVSTGAPWIAQKSFVLEKAAQR